MAIKHTNIAITTTHISAGSWLKQFQLQFCLSLLPCMINWGIKAVSSHKGLILQLPGGSAVLMQVASFIYSWLTSRKKNPRRKFALQNSCPLKFKQGNILFGGFVCLFWVGLGFFPLLPEGLVLAVSPAVGSCPTLEQWPPALQATSQAPRERTASLQTQLPLCQAAGLCCPLSLQWWIWQLFPAQDQLFPVHVWYRPEPRACMVSTYSVYNNRNNYAKKSFKYLAPPSCNLIMTDRPFCM